MRKQADFYRVFLYKKVRRTFEGGKANECRLLHVHSPAVNARGLQVSIVKATLLSKFEAAKPGCRKAAF